MADAKANGLSRSSLLQDLAQVPGVYVPSLYGQGPDGTSIVPLEPAAPAKILRLEASIDSMGRSLKPVQVQHWLAEQMGESLRMTGVQRQELKLLRC